MTVNQISVFVENKSGALAQIAGELAAVGVNMRALSIAETPDFGVLRFIADQEEKAAQVLRENGHVLIDDLNAQVNSLLRSEVSVLLTVDLDILGNCHDIFPPVMK